MTQTVLIAGGTGLIGQRLARLLREVGFEVRILSRNADSDQAAMLYGWDLDNDYIDPAALDQVDVIINLAGAGIADRRWTRARKQVLYDSRVIGNRLLVSHLHKHQVFPRLFLGASAIGIYGDRGNELLTEDAEPGGSTDFLVQLCEAWEESQQAFSTSCTRVVSVRIGMVLSNKGGALPSLSKSVIFGIGATVGTGDQYMSWIHVDDLIKLFHHVITHHQITGVVNGTAPSAVTNRQFIRSIIDQKGRQGLVLRVPAWILKLGLGEMSKILLGGARVVPHKIQQKDFEFTYKTLESALQHLL